MIFGEVLTFLHRKNRTVFLGVVLLGALEVWRLALA